MPRWSEVVLALVLLVLLAPVLLVTALVVLSLSGRPVLFHQERVGREGVPFSLWKFRTMAVAAEGSPLTRAADPRVTRPGRWLRAHRLDELPQLYNLLRGDMSFVGARPEVAALLCWDDPRQRALLRERPGVTDPASLAFRDEADLLAGQTDPERYYREVLRPAKVRLSVEYQARRTWRTDATVLRRTAACLVGLDGRRRSADAEEAERSLQPG
ncbi:MAG: putative sugar transferase [Frankiales bacterium]|nr:putative sugar transferase [Frankiales bacterium]